MILGAHTVALGAARSLGRHGIEVCAVATDANQEARSSRYVKRLLPWESGTDDPAGQLLDLVERHDLAGATVFACDDSTVLLLGQERDRLAERLVVTCPSWETMRWAHDKSLTDKLAESLGIPSPRTWVPDGPQALDDLPVQFPAILKPASKTGPAPLVADKAWRVDDPAQLRTRYAEALRDMPAGSVMVQEFVPGDGTHQLAYAALCQDGRVLASLTACRLRQNPIDFGRASTHVRTIQDESLAETGQRLLREIDYSGLVELEFKRDPRDGHDKLLDINTRLWGWHTLGPRAGVDFPWLAWLQAHGELVPEAHARPGVRWVRMRTDLPVVAREIRARRLSPVRYLASVRPPLAGAVFALDDPLPAVMGVPRLAARTLRAR